MKKKYKFSGFGKGKQFIEINDNYLTIKRKGFLQMLNHGLKGDKTINIKNITAVQVKKPGMTTGYIQFAIMGSQESKGGIFKAVQDENTVIFQSNKLYRQALEIKEYVERINNQSNIVTPTYNTISTSDELIKLKKLLDEGILTQDEFEQQKKRLLG